MVSLFCYQIGINDEKIYGLSLTELQEQLQTGELTASEVLVAYQRKVSPCSFLYRQ